MFPRQRRPFTRTPCGIYGPRHLVRRHARRNHPLAVLNTNPPPQLASGEEELYAYYAPALEAGNYSVSVSQTVTAGSSSKTFGSNDGLDTSTQTFEVVAPRYNLASDAIHSQFPPQGLSALADTLPHVVFSDPHLPWARLAENPPDKGNPDYERNQTPWLAVLAFTADEITLTKAELAAGGLFDDVKGLTTPVTQTQMGSVTVPIDQVEKIKNTASPVPLNESEPSDPATTDLVFLPADLFNELFTQYDMDGSAVSSQSAPDVSRYKFLSHTRDINTLGMADAGVEDNGVFGITVCHRTGPLTNTVAQPVIVHLVSLESVIKMKWPIKASDSKYVALTSLYSWSWSCLPAGSFDIATAMNDLSTSLECLRAPQNIIEAIPAANPTAQFVKAALQDGYTMTKHRDNDGIMTAAITRGPFTPTAIAAASPTIAYKATDLQKTYGSAVDISYSSAWELGRTLALGDQPFATALVKLRTALANGTMQSAKQAVMAEMGLHKSRTQTLESLPDSIRQLVELPRFAGAHPPNGSMAHRWQREKPHRPSLTLDGHHIQNRFAAHAREVGRQMALNSSGQMYDELTDLDPASPDWSIVLGWIMDKLFLYNFPAHYFIPDPSFLEKERLKFFYIDPNWMNAMIDGALSLGNHFEGTDTIRQTIWTMLQEYLNGPSKPQIPVYGFLLRSQLVSRYPDLKVEAKFGPSATLTGAPIIRQDILDASQGVMLCLFDVPPGKAGLDKLVFTPPPHQQEFTAGMELTAHYFTMNYRPINTTGGDFEGSLGLYTWMRPNDPTKNPHTPPKNSAPDVKHPTAVFKWGDKPDPDVRTLLFPAWAQDLQLVLATQPDGKYSDTVLNSGMVGIQLNDSLFQLIVDFSDSSQPTPTAHVAGPSSSSSLSSSIAKAPEPDAHDGRQIAAEREDEKTPDPAAEASASSPATVKRVEVRHQRSSPPPKTQPHLPCGPSHGETKTPPPHHQVLIPMHEPVSPPWITHLKAAPGGTALPPDYNYLVYPVLQDKYNRNIDMGSATPVDLVFAINQVVPNSDTSPYQLQSLRIKFQLSAGAAPNTNILTDNYTGKGPTMLANLAFNVISGVEINSNKESWFVMRLVPRSTRGYVTADRVTEAGFILPGVRTLKQKGRWQEYPINVVTELHWVQFDTVTKTHVDLIRFQAPPPS